MGKKVKGWLLGKRKGQAREEMESRQDKRSEWDQNMLDACMKKVTKKPLSCIINMHNKNV